MKPTNPNVKRCYQRALEAFQKAANAREAMDKEFWLERESYWFHLATSCAYMEGSTMVALNDAQLKVVMAAVADMPPEKRTLFLERVSAMVNIRGRRFSDADLVEIAALARTGLACKPA